MPQMKSVNVGFNKYCGPAVLSILTGYDTDQCARFIRRVNGQYNVTGVTPSHLLQAAGLMGFDLETRMPQATMHATIVSLISFPGMYVFWTADHYFVIEVTKDKKVLFCDNHSKEPMPAASSARLTQFITGVFQAVKKREISVPPPKEKARSEAIEQLVSLVHLAKFHKDRCEDSNCCISIYRMKRLADKLRIQVFDYEVEEAQELIDNTSWL